MELKETNHSYYCSDSNYYVDGAGDHNWGRCDYDSWEAFKENWLFNDGTIDDDYNHVFRFDIKKDDSGRLSLWLYFILQRKGIFRPVWIKNIYERNMEEITDFLEARYQYIKNQWVEFSECE